MGDGRRSVRSDMLAGRRGLSAWHLISMEHPTRGRKVPAPDEPPAYRRDRSQRFTIGQALSLNGRAACSAGTVARSVR